MTQLTLLNRKDYLLPSASIYIAKKAKWLKAKLNSLANRAKLVINETLYTVQLSIFKLRAGWWIVKTKEDWKLTDNDIKKSRKLISKNRLATGHESHDASWTMFDSLF